MERPEVKFGESLAHGDTAAKARSAVETRIEAVELVPRVVAFAHDHGLGVPVFAALEQVLLGKADKASVLPTLMAPSRG
jgi:glycerol-3-phosphate dehydrogenase (NAD(P)+)